MAENELLRRKLARYRDALQRIYQATPETQSDLEGAAEGHLRPLSVTFQKIAEEALYPMEAR